MLDRAVLKRVPLLVPTVRALRQLPGVARLRHSYADRFTQRVFTSIYRENQWADAESRSGAGSSERATVVVRELLPGLVRELGVRSLVDVPCGDFNWMSRVDLAGVQYIGGDIVPDMIEANARQYASPTRRFLVVDAARDSVPKADLIFCRALFLHLSNALIRSTLQHFVESGAQWLLASTYADCPENVDGRTGAHRPVNLELAPFHFPAPVKTWNETPHLAAGDVWCQYLALWRMPDVADALAQMDRHGA